MQYGHKTRFDTDEPEEDEEESEDEGGQWGGLEGIGAEVVKRKEKNKWDKEIVPFENLEWNKVTALIDPEDQPLTTCTFSSLFLSRLQANKGDRCSRLLGHRHPRSLLAHRLPIRPHACSERRDPFARQARSQVDSVHGNE